LKNGGVVRFSRRALYQIERGAIVPRLRGANVRLEKRLDGAVTVRYGEKYLPVKLCVPAEAKQEAPLPPVQPASQRRQPRRGSDWDKNFNLKKAPKVWQVVQDGGRRQGAAD
jgi:hypothetical protein